MSNLVCSEIYVGDSFFPELLALFCVVIKTQKRAQLAVPLPSATVDEARMVQSFGSGVQVKVIPTAVLTPDDPPPHPHNLLNCCCWVPWQQRSHSSSVEPTRHKDVTRADRISTCEPTRASCDRPEYQISQHNFEKQKKKRALKCGDAWKARLSQKLPAVYGNVIR